jgi:hypothetical protein
VAKPTRHRSRRQRRQFGKASLAGNSSVSTNPFVIRAGKSPYGPRQRWGQIEYAQAAICALHPNIPKNFNISALTRAVRDQLNKDPEYRAIGFRPLSRQTVTRALELLRAANV